MRHVPLCKETKGLRKALAHGVRVARTTERPCVATFTGAELAHIEHLMYPVGLALIVILLTQIIADILERIE